MCHIFFVHSSVGEHLGCFHVLAAVNTGVPHDQEVIVGECKENIRPWKKSEPNLGTDTVLESREGGMQHDRRKRGPCIEN